jgi:hypothetical protein
MEVINMKKWREDLISLMQDPAVKDTTFNFEAVFDDEDVDLNTIELVHAVDHMLFYWRFNMLDKDFGYRSMRKNQRRIKKFKMVWNRYLNKYAELITSDLMAFYDDYLGTDEVKQYIQQGFEVEDNKIKLIAEGVE